MKVDAQELPKSGVFKGIVNGDARVRSGSNLEVKGVINGDLYIEAESKVLVSGIVEGRVINDSSEVELTGIIGG